MNPEKQTAGVSAILSKQTFEQADVDALVANIESLTVEEKIRLLFTITGYKILSNDPKNFTPAERVAGVEDDQATEVKVKAKK